MQKAFSSQAEVRIEAVRESYIDALGELIAREAKIEQQCRQDGADGQLNKHQDALDHVRRLIANAKADVAHFESFDEARWKQISQHGVIGRCLDDAGELERRTLAARRNKPGETTSQVLQRIAQAFQAGVSTGVTGPLVDALGIVDQSLPGTTDLAIGDAEIGVGAAGAVAFTAATGPVRTHKATMNKQRLARKMTNGDPARRQRLEADREQWTFKAGDRTVDLRNTGAYDRSFHTLAERGLRVAKAVPASLMSGPKGLAGLAKAKRARRAAGTAMQDFVGLLEESPLERVPALPRKSGLRFAALKDRLYDFKAVRDHLSPREAQAAAAVEPTAETMQNAPSEWLDFEDRASSRARTGPNKLVKKPPVPDQPGAFSRFWHRLRRQAG